MPTAKPKPKAKSGFPKPWCGNNPRMCAKQIGLAQISISVTGMLLFICVPLTVIDVANEIAFIKDHHTGARMDEEMAVHRDYFFDLNITFNGSYDCDTITLDIQSFLTGFLVLEDELTLINFTVVRTRVETTLINIGGGLIRKQYICEVHVYTKCDPADPAVFIADEMKNYSVSQIVALAIANRTSFDAPDVLGMMEIRPPYVFKAVRQTTYPALFGNSSGRRICITNMIEADELVAAIISDVMYNLLTFCGVLSTFIGCLFISASVHQNRSLLSAMFFLEIIAISFLLIALVLVNHPLMCTLEYGGISTFGAESLRYMQTTITGIGVIYLFFKAYSVWFLATYADAVYSSPRYSKSVPVPSAVMTALREHDEAQQVAPGSSTASVKSVPDLKVEATPLPPKEVLKEVPKEAPKPVPAPVPPPKPVTAPVPPPKPVTAPVPPPKPVPAPPPPPKPVTAPVPPPKPAPAPPPAAITDVNEIHKGMTEFFRSFGKKESVKDLRKDLHKEVHKDVHKDVKEVSKDAHKEEKKEVRKDSKDKTKPNVSKPVETPPAPDSDEDDDDEYDDDEAGSDSPSDGQPLRSRDLRRKKKSAALHAAGLGGGSGRKGGREKPAGKGLFSSWW